MMQTLPGLWAVHIADAVLTEPWLLGGFVLAGALMVWGSRRVQDEEIPRIAMMTAAFFIASLIHVRVGGSSVHLLFNALVGMILGRRAVLAVAVGLFLQMLLVGHGGYLTLGVNCCVLSIPALLAGAAFRRLQHVRWGPRSHAVLIGAGTFLWTLALVYSATLMFDNPPWRGSWDNGLAVGHANAVTFAPLTLLIALLVSALAVHLERRLKNGHEFALASLIGMCAVLLTVALNGAVLILGGVADFSFQSLLLVVLHLPVALVESVIIGFTTAFLVRVNPQILAAVSCSGSRQSSDSGGTLAPSATRLDWKPDA
jgi:cobalt/nickel transport system permease protein